MCIRDRCRKCCCSLFKHWLPISGFCTSHVDQWFQKFISNCCRDRNRIQRSHNIKRISEGSYNFLCCCLCWVWLTSLFEFNDTNVFRTHRSLPLPPQLLLLQLPPPIVEKRKLRRKRRKLNRNPKKMMIWASVFSINYFLVILH